jgi:hypothetical protein
MSRRRQVLENQIALLLHRADELAIVLEEVAELDLPDRDPYEDGEVLCFEKRFTPSGKVYLYVFLRVEAQWYGTGPRQRIPVSWQSLADFMSDGVEAIFRPKEWVQEY